MIFEFLICYRDTEGLDIQRVLKDLLIQALVNSQDEFEEHDIDDMICTRQNRIGEEFVGDDGYAGTYTILGFALEMPEMDAAQAVIDEFILSLTDSKSVLHALRFEDPILQGELALRAAELFAIEMKLRRVLSFIYLHAYQREDHYDLLKEEQVQTMNRGLRKHDMEQVSENQFFHLTFNNYISLNERRDFRQVPEVLRALQDSESYDVFRGEVTRRPIVSESDAELLDDLKSLMNPIEQMRNCVAHNRRPRARDRQDYLNTLAALEKRLDRFLCELTSASISTSVEAIASSE